MGSLSTTRNYVTGELLLDTDFNDFLDDIELFLNTTKLNDDNIQVSGITASSKLANATVSTANLIDGLITTTKIADEAAIASKLTSGIVDTSNISDSSVTTAKLDAVSITTAKVPADTQASIRKLTKVEIQYPGGSFTPPAGCAQIWVEACGGGGGGGSSFFEPSYSTYYGGTRGSCGLFTLTKMNVTPLVPIAITIGAGGTGGPAPTVSNSGFNGTAGGDTLVAGVTVATGGPGGIHAGATFTTNWRNYRSKFITNLAVQPSDGDLPSGVSSDATSAVLDNNGAGGGGGGAGGSTLGVSVASFKAAKGGNGAPGLVHIWY